MTEKIDTSISSPQPRRQLTRYVRTLDAAARLQTRYREGAEGRLFAAEVKRQRKLARNRRLAGVA